MCSRLKAMTGHSIDVSDSRLVQASSRIGSVQSDFTVARIQGSLLTVRVEHCRWRYRPRDGQIGQPELALTAPNLPAILP